MLPGFDDIAMYRYDEIAGCAIRSCNAATCSLIIHNNFCWLLSKFAICNYGVKLGVYCLYQGNLHLNFQNGQSGV